MKYKKSLIFLLSVLFCLAGISAASAKITYNKRDLITSQIYGIKGLLYFVVTNSELSVQKQISAKICRALVWLEKIHKSKKVFELTKIQTEDSQTIQETIKVIVDVIMGRYKQVPPKTIDLWTKTGKRVVAEYKEELVKNSKTGEHEIKIHYKLYLNK